MGSVIYSGTTSGLLCVIRHELTLGRGQRTVMEGGGGGGISLEEGERERERTWLQIGDSFLTAIHRHAEVVLLS